MNQAILYARVSSKDQEVEGYSIPSQLKMLREYAFKNNFVVPDRIRTYDLPPSPRLWRTMTDYEIHCSIQVLRPSKLAKLESLDKRRLEATSFIIISKLNVPYPAFA